MTEAEKEVKLRCIRMYKRVVENYDEQINQLSHDRANIQERVEEMEKSISTEEVHFHSHFLIYMRDENAFLAEYGFRTTDPKEASHMCLTSAMNFINASNGEGKKDQPTAILVGCPDYIKEQIGEKE